jgi:hypothetical protein
MRRILNRGVSSEGCAGCRCAGLLAQHMAQFGTVDRRMCLCQAMSALAANLETILSPRFYGSLKAYGAGPADLG